MNIKDSTQRQFDKVMKDEGKTVYDYYTLEEYKVFFRRSYSSSISTQKVKLYFSQNTNIRKGSIVVFKNDIYIVGSLNYYESDVYYVADAIRCPTVISAGTKNIPLAITGSSIGIDTGTVRMINGNGSFYTQYNEDSKEIKINNKYNIFGREYSILNTYNIDGILFIVAELTTASYGGITDVRYLGQSIISQKTPLFYSLVNQANGGDVVFSSDNIISYTSSDTSIATVDAHGVLTPISNGDTTVTITYRVNSCLDDNSGVTSSYSHVITVGGIIPPSPGPGPTPPPTPISNNTCTVTYSGIRMVIGRTTKEFTVNCFDEDGNVIDLLNGTWSYSAVSKIDNDPIPYEDLINELIITDVGDNKKTIKVNDSALPMNLTVSYTLSENGYIGSATISVEYL